jgi:hypothetical protein
MIRPPRLTHSKAARRPRGRPASRPYAELGGCTLNFDLAVQLVPDICLRTGRPRAGFERLTDAVGEDHVRAHMLLLSGLPGSWHLAQLLLESQAAFAHDSQASATWQRQLRRVDANQLHGIITGNITTISAFTVVVAEGRVNASELPTFSTVALLRQLRRVLTKAGIPEGEWAFCQIHGEFDGRTGTFQLHFHGFATPKLIERLREWGEGQVAPGISKPVRIDQLNDLPRQLSYALQSFWPSRTTFLDSEGVVRRTREKRRITGVLGAAVLLWLNEQTLGSMRVKVGLTNDSFNIEVRKS